MAVPVFPALIAVIGVSAATLMAWYNNLSKSDQDRVNRACVRGAQRDFGKAADELCADEAKIVAVEVAKEEGVPVKQIPA